MERGFLKRLYGVDEAYQLLLTFGFILILDDAVKAIWGGVFKIPPIPDFLDGAWTVSGRSFPVYNAFVIAVGAGRVVLWFVFEKTWWGRIVRATAADREMASAIGIRRPAGIFRRVRGRRDARRAGRRDRYARTGARRPGSGSAMIIQAFIITVIGGLGNLKGAFVSSHARGMLSAYGTLYFPVFELFFIFVIMAVVLLVRPQGLFAR